MKETSLYCISVLGYFVVVCYVFSFSTESTSPVTAVTALITRMIFIYPEIENRAD